MFGIRILGFGDLMRLYELERDTGLWIQGFRPLQLDALLDWSGGVADQQRWDLDALHQHVMHFWVDQAGEIQTWQIRLRSLPRDQCLVAALGRSHDWCLHWERLLRV